MFTIFKQKEMNLLGIQLDKDIGKMKLLILLLERYMVLKTLIE